MNLLIKYYDVIADLPTGGGIPDEVMAKIEDRYGMPEQRNTRVHDALFGYSLASEELTRLNEEVEWLTRKKQVIYDVLKYIAKRRLDRIIELKGEVDRRRNIILSEPDGIVRETMIQNLLVDL